MDLALSTADVPDEGSEAMTDLLHLAVGGILVLIEEALLRISIRDNRQVLE